MEQNSTTGYLYWAAFAIPLVLIVIGGFIDKLVSKEPFQWKQFYLGLDITLAALAIGLANIIDLVKDGNFRTVTGVTTAVYITSCILFLMGLLGWHQDWLDPKKAGWGQIVRLGIASNILGGALLVAFVHLKLKGML